MLLSFSYYQIERVFKQEKENQIENIKAEIVSLQNLTNSSFDLIESALHNEVEIHALRTLQKLEDREDIETMDLNQLRVELKLDTIEEDIYIINKNGIITNTTFEPDSGMDFFALGRGFEHFIRQVFEQGRLVSEPFSIEQATKRVKKYSYVPTKNKEHVVELGIYSEEADGILALLKDRYLEIQEKEINIVSIDLFIGDEQPISLMADTIDVRETKLVADIIRSGKDTSFVVNDTLDYVYASSENRLDYSNQIVRIVYNNSFEEKVLTNELITSILIFGLGLSGLFFMLLYNVKNITKPLKTLVYGVGRIGYGKLNTRLEIQGSDEFKFLSKGFNSMAQMLEESYEKLSTQRDLLADKNAQILSSITYAKGIQEAILPPKHVFNQCFSNNFILYTPKDIVAGDFYWLEKSGDFVVFAAADCTGHGVPGAMVSVVCFTGLNRSVREFGLTTPAEILDKTNEIVIETFKNSEDVVQDGMDIALCSLNTKTGELQFSGANSTLYILKESLEEVQGDRQPIGNYNNAKKFSNHKLDVKKDQTLYLFTDGYADQFGGPKGKKMKYNLFKEIIIKNSTKSMSEQKNELEKEFNTWKGKQEQVDDVCVIGIKL